MVNEPPGLATNTELCVSEGNLVVFFFPLITEKLTCAVNILVPTCLNIVLYIW